MVHGLLLLWSFCISFILLSCSLLDLKKLTLNIRCKARNKKEASRDIRDVMLRPIALLPLQSLTVQVYRRQSKDNWSRIPLVIDNLTDRNEQLFIY